MLLRRLNASALANINYGLSLTEVWALEVRDAVLLSVYGQFMYDSGCSMRDYSETSNAVDGRHD